MSELRKCLESARDAHQAARYPGDLGADVPTPQRPSVANVAAQGAVLLAAIAAVVLLVIRLADAPVEIENAAPPPLAQVAPAPKPLALVFPALEVPAAPGDLDSLAMPSFSASLPSFPAWQLPASPPSTTKESI